jgi:hypothetical protein
MLLSALLQASSASASPLFYGTFNANRLLFRCVVRSTRSAGPANYLSLELR